MKNFAIDSIPEPLRRTLSDTTQYIRTIHHGDPAKASQVKVGFLQGRSIFANQSPFKLTRDLLCYSIIAAVGLLIGQALSPFIGGFIAVGASFYALGAVSDFREGNQLKRAIAEIAGHDEWDQIPAEKKARLFDEKTQVVTFKLAENKEIKYYVGSSFRPRGTRNYMKGHEVTEIWKHTNQLRNLIGE